MPMMTTWNDEDEAYMMTILTTMTMMLTIMVTMTKVVQRHLLANDEDGDDDDLE